MKQVLDDLNLLELMLRETQEGPEIYRPTNYWELYEKKFLPELRERGLKDFRRRKGSVLSSFGATANHWPSPRIDAFSDNSLLRKIFFNRIFVKIPMMNRFRDVINWILNQLFQVIEPWPAKMRESLYSLAYEYTKLQGEKWGAKSLEDFDISLNGNPEAVINVANKNYTTSALNSYLRYGFCSKYMDFDNTKIIVELGGAWGHKLR